MIRLLLESILVLALSLLQTNAQSCKPIYVRWPRVRLTFLPRVEGPFTMEECRAACTNEQHPARSGFPLRCAGYNHKRDTGNFASDCQIYQSDQLQNVDGHAEADDQYSFYWRYCVDAKKVCSSDYQFTFFTDRYMDRSEVARVVFTNTLEECLAKCLDEQEFACRSVSFNRTDGGCHLSAQNQLSKPRYIRLNNNPNFRIDYYESNCFNNSFSFEHECHSDGILVKVESQFAYTGALYGLYDFFTCRIEPQEQRSFQHFFPVPSVSRNCSDSIRFKDGEMILEVVLSTDGVEPLYFITPEDLTYQARCHNFGGTNSVSSDIDFVPFTEQPNHPNLTLNSTHPDGRISLQRLQAYTYTTQPYVDVEPKLVNVDQTHSGSKLSIFYKLPLFGDHRQIRRHKPPRDSTDADKTTHSIDRNRHVPHSRLPVVDTRHSASSRDRSSTEQYLTLPTLPPRRRERPERVRSQTIDLKPTTTTTTTRRTTTTTRRRTTPTTTSTTRRTTQSPSTRRPTRPRLPPRESTERPSTPTTTTTTTTTSTTPTPTPKSTTTTPIRPILFDIFNGGTPVQAVVVGTRVTLSFTPFYAIPPSYMTIAGCQVEPVGSQYEWEREPLPIIKDGCQADSVGLVCPPERTDFGIRTKVEAFRYQTTAEVQYTCLVRVCAFAPCPQTFCPPVEGCQVTSSVVTADHHHRFSADRQSQPARPTFQSHQLRRVKRQFSNLPASLSQLPSFAQGLLFPSQHQQLNLPAGLIRAGGTHALTIPGAPPGINPSSGGIPAIGRPPPALQEQLIALGGDHVVKKKLIVVNSENELQYYLRTGSIPNNQLSTPFFQGR